MTTAFFFWLAGYMFVYGMIARCTKKDDLGLSFCESAGLFLGWPYFLGRLLMGLFVETVRAFDTENRLDLQEVMEDKKDKKEGSDE